MLRCIPLSRKPGNLARDVGAWFFAVLYLFGFPAAYYSWYRPLYRAMRTDSALKFGWFFLCYSIHIVFCVLAAVAPPFIFRANSLTLEFDNREILHFAPKRDIEPCFYLQIFFFLGAGFFTLESVISIWVVQQVFMYFRGSGKAAEMKKEIARSTINAAM
ncbi:hypothetical protein RND71_035208 [Anisodus tanguticus]|uniref:Secretory carrier-associated membrane protein n=1 Tax=Anisodus tanguticus TaxID=243964 RepID=A0AAE1R7A3_9SOLA|nr:hypothetical protein RND71_035208 [Anisodus tanguticus]